MLCSRDVGLLRPDVAANCLVWLERCHSEGLDVLVTGTVRDSEYQQYLYRQGRTRPGNIVTNSPVPTFHSDRAGLAWDFCKNKKGHEYDDGDFFRRAGAIAKEMGFTWGGDWRSFPDAPHIQWDLGGQWTGEMILRGELPPEMPRYTEETEVEEMRYQSVEECPGWAQEAIRSLTEKHILKGSGEGLDLSLDMIRLLVILHRAGVFGE